MSIQEVTQAHLVAFHPERDLLPMLLANCNYSLEAKGTTEINYDYEGLERQLEERFIRGRPRLNPVVKKLNPLKSDLCK